MNLTKIVKTESFSLLKVRHLLAIILILQAFVVNALDNRDLVADRISRLGYCYQFPAVYENADAEKDRYLKENTARLEDVYIKLVLTAAEGHPAYKTKKALEQGRKLFLNDITVLDSTALHEQYLQCEKFLQTYINRVLSIEKRKQEALELSEESR